MNLKDKIAHTIPLLREALRHNIRALLNDLGAPLVKELERAIGGKLPQRRKLCIRL